jgi:hypothetical protein
MLSIRITFTSATAPDTPFSTYWLLVFAIAILDDEQYREERRKKRGPQPRPSRKPPAPC